MEKRGGVGSDPVLREKAVEDLQTMETFEFSSYSGHSKPASGQYKSF